MTQIPGEQMVVCPDLLDRQAVMERALPVLRTIHQRQIVLTAKLPADHQVLSAHCVEIGAYYLNSTDPSTLGYWRMSITAAGSEDTFLSRIEAIPGERTEFVFTTKTDRGFEPVVPLQEQQMLSVLDLVGRVTTSQASERLPGNKKRVAAHIAGLLLRRESTS